MSRITETQQKQLDAGTHVMDAVHGFVPKLPVGAAQVDGDKVQVDTIDPAPAVASQPQVDEAARLKAEGQAVKQTEKEQR